LGWGQGESRAAVKPSTGCNVLHLAANSQLTRADQADLVGETVRLVVPGLTYVGHWLGF